MRLENEPCGVEPREGASHAGGAVWVEAVYGVRGRRGWARVKMVQVMDSTVRDPR